MLISGEPGIGKSRLTAELSERIRQRAAHARMRYFCSPHHQDSALYPFITQLERAAGFARDDTPEEKLDKLQDCSPRRLPATTGFTAGRAAVAADHGRHAQSHAAAQAEKLFEALLHQLEAFAGTGRF